MSIGGMRLSKGANPAGEPERRRFLKAEAEVSDLVIEEMSYEQAFGELERIVTALESGQGTLEDAIALFERGQGLAQRCADLLDQAELRVRRLNLPETPAE